MARIIETDGTGRRIIKMTTDDIISVVQDYQNLVHRGANYNEIRNCLENAVIYIPEDL